MEANELMIGDWVNYSNNPQRIKGAIDFTFAKDFAPIPLTAEILEKNGFKIGYGVHKGNEGLIDDGNKHYYVKVGRWGNHKDEVGHTEVWNVCIDQHSPIYVHELQHALRQCKLTDLADNFKV